MPVRDALLLRDASGALYLERAGKRRLIEPAACKGRVVHADPLRELFIIGCAPKKRTGRAGAKLEAGRIALELVTPSERRPLNVELASVELDREVSDSPRLVALYPGAETRLFDADRRELLALQAGDVVVATRNGHALIRRGKSLLFYDADGRSELPVTIPIDKNPDVFVSPPFAFVSPVLVNLDAALVVGSYVGRALALSNHGQLLVAESEPDAARLVHGPLRWLTPGS